MKSQKSNIKIMFALFLLCSSVVLGGCSTNWNVNETSSTAKPSESITATETQTETTVTPAVTPIDTPIISPTVTQASMTGTVLEDVTKDLDGNEVDDKIQIISLDDDGVETGICVYLNGEQIFEFKDHFVRLMGVNAFEYLDLDGDGTNEIFIAADTNANCRTLVDVLCLKKIEGHWNRMDISLNEMGNNGFCFKVTRGKDEFEFIISSDIFEQEIHFDASHLFVDDESGNIDSIQAFRKNNYKEGDEVDFSIGWGICEARTGTYEGRNCIIATEGLEVPYGHSLGDINTYFAYNEQGKVEILNVEYFNLEESVKEPGEIAENFFSAFEKANYESMETFCTEECVDKYFHEGDVFGMVWAKATKIGEIQNNLNENVCGILVDVEMETAKTSALYPETETSFYVVLKKQSDESWLIDSFVTSL